MAFWPFSAVDRETAMDATNLGVLGLDLAIGAGLGFFGGVFGIGGGIIAIPLFVLAFAMEQPLAQGTALVMMVPNLLIAFWRYCQRHPLDWRAMASIGASATTVTWLVAGFANRLDPLVLRMIFAGFLGVLGLTTLLRRHRTAAEGTALPRNGVLGLVGALGGCSMGLLGIGGGLVATPVLSNFLKQRQVVAQSLALALVAPSSVAALAAYSGAGRVDWQMGLPMAVGGLLTVSPGVALAHRLPERRMRLAFGVLLLATALSLLFGIR